MITENSAYGSNGPSITPERPGLIKTEAMSCLVTTFYCTKMTHDNGSCKNPESGIITPESSRLMVRILQYQTNRLKTSMSRRIDSLIVGWGTNTCNHELVKVLKREIGKCEGEWCYVYLSRSYPWQEHEFGEIIAKYKCTFILCKIGIKYIQKGPWT